MGGFNFGGGFGALFGHGATNALTRANNRISALNAKSRNDTRMAQNAAAAAEGNLARFVQSVNNNRALEAGGNAQEALLVNFLRGRDNQGLGSFSENIRVAEAAGHSAAAAAAAGVDGNVVDMVNGSTALRDSIVRQSVEDKQSKEAYDVSRRAGTIMSQMIGGLDASIIMDRLDYNQDFATVTPELSVFSQTLNGFFQGAQWYNQGTTANGQTIRSDNAETYRMDTERRRDNAEAAGVDYNENYGNEARGQDRATYNPDYGNEDRRSTDLWSVDDQDYSDLWSS